MKTDMSAKCEMFMNCSKNFGGICKKKKKKNMSTKRGYKRHHRCEGTSMA